MLAAYLVLLAGGTVAIDVKHDPLRFLGYVAVLSVLLLVVCLRTGEPPRWRWGGR